MSIVFLFGLMLSAATGWAAGYGVHWIVNRIVGRKTGQAVAIVAGLAIGAASTYPIIVWLSKASTTTIIGMDSQTASRHLSFLGLPAHSTSDICFRRSAVGIYLLADFDMPEAEFLKWMKSQNFKFVAFDATTGRSSIEIPGERISADTEVFPVRDFEERKTLLVKRGYCYFHSMPDHPDHTDQVTYDLDSGRVYVMCTLY